MKCPECGVETERLVSASIGVTYITPRCRICLGLRKQDPTINPLYQQHDREAQRDRHNADILQPYNPNGTVNRDFAHQYKHKARDYYSEKELGDV